MSTSNIRLFFALIFSGIILFSFNYFSKNPQSLKNLPENITFSLSKIQLPKIDLSSILTLKIKDQMSLTKNNQINQQQNTNTFFTLPTEAVENRLVEQPKEQPKNQVPIQISPTKIPIYIPTKIPTLKPTLKPTKPPKPTPTSPPPPVTSSQRPGTTLKEIYQEVSKRTCVPEALLYAFQQAETGAWWTINSPSSKVKIYNKYGWWIDGSGDPCTGMGYHTQTGIVPQDSVNAGVSCQKPIPSGDDQAIMGLWQISKYEEDAAKKYIGKIISGNIDRRVIFDNAVIFAIITKNRVAGGPPSNCNDWPTDVIKIVAQKHYGSCGDNYCDKILNYYRQYK
jgi:hypothetical protein